MGDDFLGILDRFWIVFIDLGRMLEHLWILLEGGSQIVSIDLEMNLKYFWMLCAGVARIVSIDLGGGFWSIFGCFVDAFLE